MKADGFGRDDVHQRPALHAGKNNFVDGRRVFGFRQNQSGARAAQRLVRGRGDDLRVRHRRRMRAAGNQSGEVRHIDQVDRANFVGDLPHAREVDDARIGAAAADDQLGPLAFGDLLQLVVVDGLGFARHAVGNDLVGLAGEVQRMSVREMPAVGEVQAKDGVAGLNDRGIGRHVGGGAGVRLHVGVLGAEELLGAVAGQVLDHVGELASAVIALAGIAFGVLVGEDRACRFQHGFADKVLRGDQLQAFVLAALFVLDSLRDLRIDFRQRTLQRIAIHDFVLR